MRQWRWSEVSAYATPLRIHSLLNCSVDVVGPCFGMRYDAETLRHRFFFLLNQRLFFFLAATLPELYNTHKYLIGVFVASAYTLKLVEARAK